MTDITHEEGQGAPVRRRAATLAHWSGAAVSLALVAGIAVWGYKLIIRDVSGIPVVAAMEGPMRVAPTDPGGELADHQGLAVNAVAGTGIAAPPADRLVLAPSPAGLSEEDIAAGALDTLQPEVPFNASLAREAGLVEPDATAAPLAEDSGAVEDPLKALVAQLVGESAAFSDLAPGEDVPVETALSDPEAEAEAEVMPLSDASGLVRSLRPRSRPQALQVASLAEPAVTRSDASPVAGPQVRELDAAALPVGTRLVQIGAFDSPETARAEWERLMGRFGDYLAEKDRVIQEAHSGGRTFYRLRAHGFEDLGDARRFCAAFVAGNIDCIPVVTR